MSVERDMKAFRIFLSIRRLFRVDGFTAKTIEAMFHRGSSRVSALNEGGDARDFGEGDKIENETHHKKQKNNERVPLHHYGCQRLTCDTLNQSECDVIRTLNGSSRSRRDTDGEIWLG